MADINQNTNSNTPAVPTASTTGAVQATVIPTPTVQALATQNNGTNGTPAKKVVVVEYKGTGVWTDGTGEHWASHGHSNSDFKSQRQYDIGEYNKRQDIQFMVKYGSMSVTEVEI